MPQCGEVVGTPAVTFSRNGGFTLAPTRERLQGFGYTLGLVALDRPDTLVAVFNDDAMISTDAGCSWKVIPGLPEGIFPPYLVAGKNGRVYGWADNRQQLFRLDEERITMLKSPIDAIIGVGIDPQNSDRLKIGSTDGAVWESSDAGSTWSFVGGARLPVPLGYRMAFDATTLDHIVLGSAVAGAFVSMDGGVTWRQSTGFTRSNAGANVFNVRIAPSNGSVVWAMALDMGDSESPSRGRAIFRSIDGGVTFEPKVAASPEISLINGPTMAIVPGMQTFSTLSSARTFRATARTFSDSTHPGTI